MAKTPTTNLWIGLYSRSGQRFHWTDGRPMRYSNWGSDRDHLGLFYDDEIHYYIQQMYKCAAMTANPRIGRGQWTALSCNDTNGYVCLQNLDPSLPDSPEPTVPIEYVKVFNDSIKVVTQPLNWDAAQKRCQSDDANLASLRNGWSEVYIELMALNLNSPLWIGLKKTQTGRYFTYVDGWHMTLSNWDTGEPSVNQDCVYVDVDGKWKTADCNKKMTSVCMKTTDIPPTESSDFPGFCPEDPETTRYGRHKSTWLPFKGHCYLFNTGSTEWPDASAKCMKYGATLASIEDPSEQQFIQNNVNIYKDSESSFWIGLYKTHKDLWKWLDKTVMDYTNWDVSQPGKGIYATIDSSNGGWSTSRQWPNRGYICKITKVLRDTPSTTVSPTVDLQTHGHIILTIVLVISTIGVGIFIVLFILKKSGHRLCISEKSTNFDNAHNVSSNEQFLSDLVATNELVPNAEEESPEPVIML